MYWTQFLGLIVMISFAKVIEFSNIISVVSTV